ncbi:methyltransferase [Nocardioides aurantiacus]|uniref:Methyltransferase family protein n=1 Tax=Nocardioides aurantiacus TaxID=86796 RepID=A0A3N2CWQ4_9ACTN|nr:class I SAM-dependent methyltransferase [Nocardioides aurantiacus]ROR91624.1 methyltransferase family protein [Nocardioides aurantiacus]
MSADAGLAGEMEYGELVIRFDDRVLRPRPWTAAQSRWAADLLRSAPPGPVLELCSGAGHIGLLAVHASDRRLVCVDANPAATELTLANAAAAGMADRVETREGWIRDVLRPDETFPLVVADPPWVPAAETGRFPEDPLLAIDGGEDGLVVVHEVLGALRRHLAPGGVALLQLGTTAQAEAVGEALGGSGLVPGELREYGDRGVLLRLDRPT